MNFDKLLNFLKLDSKEFYFQFNSHPNYPSALAFSDTLNFLGIKNDAYEVEKEFWNELPKEFMTIVNNSFSLVQNNDKDDVPYTIYSDKISTINKEDLYKNSTNFVLLFEKTEMHEKKPSSIVKPLFYIIGALILGYSFSQHNWYGLLFNMLSLLGVYISLEIFNQKFGTTSTVINSICGNTVSNQSANACNQIISHDKTDIFGLKFSDFSLIYFIGLSIIGLFLPSTSYFVLGSTLLSIAVIGYSVYVQAFVEKTFCKICLLIISILIAQLVVSHLFFTTNLVFDFRIILLCLTIMTIALAGVLYINTIRLENQSLEKSNANNLKFKRNFELFQSELLNQEKINFQNSDVFFIGAKDAKLHIDIVTNPYCGFCKDAHKLIENLLKKYPQDISAQIRFNYFQDKRDDKYTELISAFDDIYKNNGEKSFLRAIEEWFEYKDENKITKKRSQPFGQNDLQPIIDIAEENLNAGLSFTPALIINGYQFPNKYNREDLPYFIDDLIDNL